MKQVLVLVLFLFLTLSAGTGYAATQFLDFVPPASNSVQQGFLRFTNLSGSETNVTLSGIDDAGFQSGGTITFSLAPSQSKQINSQDIEGGNVSKGISGSFGDGVGNWRVVVNSTFEVKASAFIRTSEGFLTQVDSTVPDSYGRTHQIPIFNPASNENQVSILRVINRSSSNNSFTLTAVDDSGLSPGGVVTFTLSPLQTFELSAIDLELGNFDKGITGSIGDGDGKWYFEIQSSQPATVMNFMVVPGGYISNLSNFGNKEVSFANVGCSEVDGARIYSQDDEQKYLGFFGNDFASDSVNNLSGNYGSEFASDSIRNNNSTYGSPFTLYSHSNESGTKPPVVVKNGITLFYLSLNQSFVAAYSLSELDAACTFSASTASNTFAIPQ